MNTLVCIPIQVDDIDAALADANQAKLLGADIVELRIDTYFPGCEGDEEDAFRLEQLRGLLADCPLPVILTCRSAQEGGDYDGDEADRVSILEKLCIESDHPPAYLDFELASYQKSKNIRQKINFCVDHPKQERDVRTRLILSMHDFDGRPADLMRRLADAWAEPAATVVKFAFRARSIRDNLEIFEILRDAPKPTIGIGMGEFGLMSRVLAPKFGGYLTFASLRDEAATAPGQPTIADLLGMYRFRSIGRDTRVYGVIGWPVSQSMSPLVHNAGFEARGVDAVYLPLPVPDSDSDSESSDLAFETTTAAIFDDPMLQFTGASITLPHKERAAKCVGGGDWTEADLDVKVLGAANTLSKISLGRDDSELKTKSIWAICSKLCAQLPGVSSSFKRKILVHANGYEYVEATNSDARAIWILLSDLLGRVSGKRIVIIGAGGAARAAVSAVAAASGKAIIVNRSHTRAQQLVDEFNARHEYSADHSEAVEAFSSENLSRIQADAYINCTPVGMTGGPDPDGLSIPIHDLYGKVDPDTVFFDTVYNPIETPMLKAAKHYGFRTIDGVEMFVKQAAAQFELWTGEQAPIQLFDRLVREKLS